MIKNFFKKFGQSSFEDYKIILTFLLIIFSTQFEEAGVHVHIRNDRKNVKIFLQKDKNCQKIDYQIFFGNF